VDDSLDSLDSVQSVAKVHRRLTLQQICVSFKGNCGSTKLDVQKLAVSRSGHRIEVAEITNLHLPL